MQELFASREKYSSFNSTLVQLKVWLRLRIDWQNTSFNSTLVQLKDFGCKKIKETTKSFNSTLVQLKATPETPAEVTPVPFQFYLSSIKS